MGNRPKIKKPPKELSKSALKKQQLREQLQQDEPAVPKVSAKLTKKAKKKLKEISDQDVIKTIKPTNAFDYLEAWGKRETEEWKFRKTQHVWLIRNWKKSDLFKDTNFNLFLHYMKGDKSSAKPKLIEEAQKVVDSETSDEVLGQRARKLIQDI